MGRPLSKMHQPHFSISGSDHYSGSDPGRGSGSLAFEPFTLIQPARIICPGLFGTSAPQCNSCATICVHSGPKRRESHDFVSKNDRLGKADHAKPPMMVEIDGNMVWKDCGVKPRNPHLFVTLPPPYRFYPPPGQLTSSPPAVSAPKQQQPKQN